MSLNKERGRVNKREEERMSTLESIGYTQEQIAEKLGRDVKTVRYHLNKERISENDPPEKIQDRKLFNKADSIMDEQFILLKLQELLFPDPFISDQTLRTLSAFLTFFNLLGHKYNDPEIESRLRSLIDSINLLSKYMMRSFEFVDVGNQANLRFFSDGSIVRYLGKERQNIEALQQIEDDPDVQNWIKHIDALNNHYQRIAQNYQDYRDCIRDKLSV
jgi:hypothetical protein